MTTLNLILGQQTKENNKYEAAQQGVTIVPLTRMLSGLYIWSRTVFHLPPYRPLVSSARNPGSGRDVFEVEDATESWMQEHCLCRQHAGALLIGRVLSERVCWRF
jgi:hypothetical protein